MRHSYSLKGYAAITALAGSMLALSAACSAPPQRAISPAAATRQSSVSADHPVQFDPRVVTGTLKNGLTYYLLRHEPDKKRVQLGLVVKAGAVHEDEDQQGFAHFVEHMAFNGTRRFEKRSLVDLFERFGMSMGRDANANTQLDRTQFWLTIPSELSTLVATALDVLEDWADGISFDPEEVEKERPVLLSEWLTGQGAARRVGEQTRKLVTAGSRFAERDVVGGQATLERGSRERLVDFYRRWYRPDRMAVIAAGDLEPAAMRRAIEQRFSRLSARADFGLLPNLEIPVDSGVDAAAIADPEVEASSVEVSIKLSSVPPKTEAAVQSQMAVAVAAQALLSRLSELTRAPNPPLVGTTVHFAPGIYGHLDLFTVTARPKAGQALDTMRLLLIELERVRQHGFTEEEARRYSGEFGRWLDHQVAAEATVPVVQVASALANSYVTGNPILSAQELRRLGIKTLPNLHAADLGRALQRYFEHGKRHLFVSGPTRDNIPDRDTLLALQAEVSKQSILAFAAPGELPPLMPQLPTPGTILREQHINEIDTTVWSLSNGVTVVVKPTDFNGDQILEQSLGHGGFSVASAAEFPSVRFAHEIVAWSGIGGLDQQTMARVLGAKLAQVFPWISDENQGIRGRAAPKDIETLLQLIHLYATAPRRDPSAFEIYRSWLRERLRNRDLNPSEVFADAISKELWNNHPRRMPASLQAVAEMDLDKALNFYKQRFADMSGFTFVFVGKIEPTTFKPLVERYLASLPGSGHKETFKDLRLHRRKGITKVRVAAGADEKATFNLIYHGESPWSEDAHTDLNSISSYLSLRLPEVLREEMGGVYQVFVREDFQRVPYDAYTLSIRFDCKPSELEKLVHATQGIIADLKRTGVPASYLEKMKAQRIRNLGQYFHTNELWLERFVEKYKMSEDPRDIYIVYQLTNRVTSDNIRAAAQHFLRDDQYVDARRLPAATAERSASTNSR